MPLKTGLLFGPSTIKKTDEVLAWEAANEQELTWAGGVYVDPDHVVGSTSQVATIYPDGTVKGSNSYGSYTKYPNGKIHINKRLDTNTITDNDVGSIWISPIVESNLPIALISSTDAVATFSISNSTGIPWVSGWVSSTLTVKHYSFSGATGGSGRVTYDAIGDWK